MWANWANGSSLQFLYDSRPTSTNGVYPALYLNSNTLVWYVSSGARITSSTLSNNTWYHIAICRSSGSTKLFVNGVQEGSTYTDANNYLNPDSRPTIGREGYGTSWNFNGYIDDLRVTKGVARYTSAFTPPDEIDLSTDTHREYVTLFLDGDGTPNGQNNTFTDGSTNDFTVTKNGDVTQGVFSPYGDNWSNYFDGSGDYLTIPSTQDVALGSGDFTIECWANFSVVGAGNGQGLFQISNGHLNSQDGRGPGVGISNSNGQWYIYYGAGTNLNTTLGSSPSANTWYHVAFVRTSGVIKIFIDGTQTGSDISYSGNYTDTYLTIGGWYSSSFLFNGYISNMRVVKGTAVYTSNFTPPTSPLTDITNTSLLTCQSNRFVDESTNNHTVTVNGDPEVTRFSPFESNKPYDITTDGGSGYFDGSGDYLSADSLNIGNFGTADFTVEGWFYLTTAPVNYIAVCETRLSGATTTGWTVSIDGSGSFYVYSGAYIVQSSANTIESNTWYHYAYTRESGTHRLFLNGSLIGSSTTARTYSDNNFRVGANLAGLEPFTGYESDVRVVKGTAVYTSAFTPPTAPLTAVTNTELLLNFQDSAIPDLSGLNNIDTAGNAKVGASDPTKYGSNAMQFDGSSDYLLSKSESSLYAFGTGDFTIEMWIYPTSLTSAEGGTVIFYDQRPLSTDGNYPVIYMQSGQLRYFVNNADRITGSTLSTNTWYHVAVCRSGTSTKMFLNGTQDGSTYSDSTSYLNGADRPVIGTRGHTLGDNDYIGYIDDLRITKGVARYTANFTPPTAALPKF
jgi:hypothetical protein